jgi:hypothetical protein
VYIHRCDWGHPGDDLRARVVLSYNVQPYAHVAVAVATDKRVCGLDCPPEPPCRLGEHVVNLAP